MKKVYLAVRKNRKYDSEGEVTFECIVKILDMFEEERDAEEKVDEDYYSMMDELDDYELRVYNENVELIDCSTYESDGSYVSYMWEVIELEVKK
jgi:hypothetical protein